MLSWRWGFEKMEFGQDRAFVHDRSGCMVGESGLVGT